MKNNYQTHLTSDDFYKIPLGDRNSRQQVAGGPLDTGKVTNNKNGPIYV